MVITEVVIVSMSCNLGSAIRTNLHQDGIAEEASVLDSLPEVRHHCEKGEFEGNDC